MAHQTPEHLTAAAQAASIPVSALRDALKTANAVQGLAILALIERAATLARDIDALRAAVAEDDDGAASMRGALRQIAQDDPDWDAATIARNALAA